MRLTTPLLIIFLLQSSFALPAAGHAPALPDQESAAGVADTHCSTDDTSKHGDGLDCNMDCQCPLGSGTGILVNIVSTAMAAGHPDIGLNKPDAEHAARPDPPFRPPRRI
jgi:hypothetical protein